MQRLMKFTYVFNAHADKFARDSQANGDIQNKGNQKDRRQNRLHPPSGLERAWTMLEQLPCNDKSLKNSKRKSMSVNR